jgi:hypothetical protein
MSSTLGPDHVEQMLNRQAKTHHIAKQGTFDVTLEDDKLVVKWSSRQRTEQFLVKEPTTQREAQGTITDVFFRLNKRLASQPIT